jgi:dipeptidyl-peptidase-4
MPRFLIAWILLCSAWATSAEKKPITLEALAAVRPPAVETEPVWSPDGKQLVYTESGKVWLYDIASRSRRELVSLGALEAAATKVPAQVQYAWENRRVREEPVQWLPSGHELLISAGGDLFLFRIAAGGWSQLTATPEAERDPKVSPDGSRVSFRREHDLYAMEIASRKVTRLTDDSSDTLWNGELDWVYPEELDLDTAYWWSPDSKSLAYLQFDVSREPLYPQVDLTGLRAVLEPERYPQAGEPNADVRLGVVLATGGRTLWMNTGETRDALLARFRWLPDSSGIAVQRLNRIQNHLELLIADAKTGDARTVLRETDSHWINVHDGPEFLKGGSEFLWQSERDGFNHLYRYSVDGRSLGQVTQGDWEVTELAGVDDAGHVYYVSTEASPLERQLYRVDLDGGGKRRISTEAGTHSVSLGSGAAYYLDSFSSLTEPLRKTIRRGDGSELAVFAEPDRTLTNTYDVRPSEIVQVKAADGATLYARLIRPTGFDQRKKYPAIIEVYGGPGVQMVQNRWYGSVTLEQVLVHSGYAIWMLDGRGSSGRGHRWEGAVFRGLGAKELEDQKTGVRHLISMGFVDPARIGIYGWSYGGFMTLYSLLHAPDVFNCGVAGAPVTNWRNYDTIYTERYMGLPSDNAEAYEKASPVNAAADLKGRLLIAHNFEDDNVLFQNTVQMADALERAGKPFGMMVYPGKTHGLTRDKQNFSRLLVAFFEKMKAAGTVSTARPKRR